MRRTALLLLALLALTGCGGGDDEADEAGPVTTTTPASAVEDLGNILDLRSDFEADAGKARVIVLLSPT